MNTEKDFDKNPTCFHDKSPRRMGSEEIYLIIIKDTYDKNKRNITLK